MARDPEIERRLNNWARYRLTRGTGALGYASVNLSDPTMIREPYAEAPIPTNAIEASETDGAIMLLPGELRAAVESHYLAPGGLAQKLARLCCSKATLYNRIERAQRLLAEHFASRADKARAERARVEALQIQFAESSQRSFTP